MQTNLSPELLAVDQGQEANGILRACVHCGFCLATCPSYQILGNELDSPRGRIYLIKEMLEGASDGSVARSHLDRCLTCRACETTCPSGVEYGRLLEFGRTEAERRTQRSLGSRFARWALRKLVPRWQLLRLGVALGNFFRRLLPGSLSRRVPRLRVSQRAVVPVNHPRRVLVLGGCVQRAVTPDVNVVLTRLLDSIGVTAVRAAGEGCCGALPLHLAADDEARSVAARNVDAIWPWIQAGAEAVISTASGCGVTVQDYGRLLADDPERAEAAARIAAMTVDVSTYLAAEPIEFSNPQAERVAYHPPCSLQHGQQVRGVVEALLTRAGYELTPVPEAHLCCGSAGTYSILHSDVSDPLRRRKVEALQSGRPERVATGNIGCEVHLASELDVPIGHWLELLEKAGPFRTGTTFD